MRRRAAAGSTAHPFLALLGATRGGSSGCLGYSGGQGASCSPWPGPAAAMSKKGSSDWGSSAIPAQGSPRLRTRSGTVRMVSSSGSTVSTSSQRQRSRDLTTDPGPGEPRAEDGLVRSILVEVDEDPLAALLLPPFGGDQVGMPAFEFAGQGHGAGPDLEAVPARLEPDVDVDAAVPGRLRVPDHAQLVQQGPHAGRPPPGSRRTRYRVGDRDRCGARRRGRGHRPGRATGAAPGIRG